MYSYHKIFLKVFFTFLFCMFLVNLSSLFADPKPPDKNYFEFSTGIYVKGIGVGGAQGAVKNGSFNLFGKGYVKINVTDLAGDLAITEISEGLSYTVSGQNHMFTGTGDVSFNASDIYFQIAVSGGQNSKINELMLVGDGYLFIHGSNGFTIKETDTHISPKITHAPEVIDVRTNTMQLKASTDLPVSATVYFKSLDRGEHALMNPEGEPIPLGDYETFDVPGYNLEHEIFVKGLNALTPYEVFLKFDFPVNTTNVDSELFPIHTDNVNLHPFYKEEAKGYYYVKQITNESGGKEWWLISPNGHALFFTGVNGVTPALAYAGSILEKHGSYKEWAKAVGEELMDLNFSAGGRMNFSDHTYETMTDKAVFTESPYVVYTANHNAPGDEGFPPEVIDKVFVTPWDPVYVESIKEQSKIYGGLLKKNPHVVAHTFTNEANLYYGDEECNEQAPYTDHRFQWARHLIDKPEGDIGKEEYVNSLQIYHNGDVNSFNALRMSEGESEEFNFDPVEDWEEVKGRSFLELYGPENLKYANPDMRDELGHFTELLFKEFLTVTIGAMRDEADYDGPIVPVTLPWCMPPRIAKVFAEFPDDNLIVGLTNYNLNPYTNSYQFQHFQEIYNLTQRPIIFTEITVSSTENGRNPSGYPFVEKEEERGPAYANYLFESARFPFVIGLQWYTYLDHNGITDRDVGFDDSYEKWGMHRKVSLDPYEDLLESMKTAHAEVYTKGTDLRTTFSFNPAGKNQEEKDTRSNPRLKFMNFQSEE